MEESTVTKTSEASLPPEATVVTAHKVKTPELEQDKMIGGETIRVGEGESVVVMKRLPRRGNYANEKGKVVMPNGKTRYYDVIKSDAARKRLVALGAYDQTNPNGLTSNDIIWNSKKRRFVNKHVSMKAKSNKWMVALSNAREQNLETFEYNDKTYYRTVTATGMTIYKQQKEGGK